MFKLIHRDYRAGALYLLALSAMWILQGLMFYPFNLFVMVGAVFSSLLPLTFFALDAKYEADLQCCSLPVTRSMVVYARYLGSLFLVVIGVAVTVLLGMVFSSIISRGGADLVLLMSVRGVLGLLLTVVVFLSLFYPFVFRSGLQKGFLQFAVASVLLVVVLLGLDYLISVRHGYDLFSRTPFTGLAEVVGGWIMGLGTFVRRLLAGLFMLVVVGTSLRLSVRFYRKRDL